MNICQTGCVFVFFVVVQMSAMARAEDLGNASIRANVGGSALVITTTARVAGAIHSLTWNGKEFIDSYDHGRQLQSASNFDCDGKFVSEVFNPTEAGSMSDGAGAKSSSTLLEITARGNELQTTSQMAFWLAPGETSQGHPACNQTRLSEHRLQKRVKIGHGRLPHAIEYDVSFTLPKNEPHRFAQFESLTGYMPAEFEKFFAFDPQSGELTPLDQGPGEQARPLVFSTADGNHAMGVYSPDQPSKGYETAGYGRWKFTAERVVKWNCVFRIRDPGGIKPGKYSFHHLVVVGTRNTVQDTLRALHAKRLPAAGD